MAEFINELNTSWEMLSDTVAVKATDQSALRYNEIRITNEIKDFFDLATMARHERRDLNFHYEGRSYPCVVYLDSYDKGRGKLRWGREFRSVFNELVSGYFIDGPDDMAAPIIRFKKMDSINYEISLIFVHEIVANAMAQEKAETSLTEEIEANYRWRIETQKMHGTHCSLCGLQYLSIYGEAGKGRLEIHLRDGLKQGDPIKVASDLIPVCANCHNILHTGIAPEELGAMIRLNREFEKLR